MSPKPFRFHPGARQDLREATAWYWERSRGVAVEFRITASDAIRQIIHAPQRWPKYLHGTRRFLLHRFPFAIIHLDDPIS